MCTAGQLSVVDQHALLASAGAAVASVGNTLAPEQFSAEPIEQLWQPSLEDLQKGNLTPINFKKHNLLLC